MLVTFHRIAPRKTRAGQKQTRPPIEVIPDKRPPTLPFASDAKADDPLIYPHISQIALLQPAKRVGISTRFSQRVSASRMGCCVFNGPVPQTLLIRAVFTCRERTLPRGDPKVK